MLVGSKPVFIAIFYHTLLILKEKSIFMLTIPFKVRSKVKVSYRPAPIHFFGIYHLTAQPQKPISISLCCHISCCIWVSFPATEVAYFYFPPALSLMLIYRTRWGQFLQRFKQEALQCRWDNNGLTRFSRRLAALDRTRALCWATLRRFGSLHHPAFCGKRHKESQKSSLFPANWMRELHVFMSGVALPKIWA